MPPASGDGAKFGATAAPPVNLSGEIGSPTRQPQRQHDWQRQWLQRKREVDAETADVNVGMQGASGAAESDGTGGARKVALGSSNISRKQSPQHQQHEQQRQHQQRHQQRYGPGHNQGPGQAVRATETELSSVKSVNNIIARANARFKARELGAAVSGDGGREGGAASHTSGVAVSTSTGAGGSSHYESTSAEIGSRRSLSDPLQKVAEKASAGRPSDWVKCESRSQQGKFYWYVKKSTNDVSSRLTTHAS